MPAVTPCVGVWIEIIASNARAAANYVTPCVGVWIEIRLPAPEQPQRSVTPCVGVWIEIPPIKRDFTPNLSLPAWECGLKSP